MLVAEMKEAGVELRLETAISGVERMASGFRVMTSAGTIDAASLVVASGGKSIPKMGATGLAYRIAEEVGLPVVETRPALVPLTLDQAQLAKLSVLAGVAADAEVRFGKAAFREAVLITHRGLSGPAILQISSYWREGAEIVLRLMPDIDIAALLKGNAPDERPPGGADGARRYPAATACALLRRGGEADGTAARRPFRQGHRHLVELHQAWTLKPAGSGDTGPPSDTRRRRYARNRLPDDAGQEYSWPLFHR